MNKYIDGLFKVAIIVLGIILLVIYYQSTLNQRFQFHKWGPEDHYLAIFDPKTGDLYLSDRYPNRGEWEKVEPIKKAIQE